jgi:hypothetical protein
MSSIPMRDHPLLRSHCSEHTRLLLVVREGRVVNTAQTVAVAARWSARVATFVALAAVLGAGSKWW